MTPKGFFSYAHDDDEHLGHALTDLRARIAGEVSMVLGEDIDMFQDIKDLGTGDRWAEKLRAELSEATFLIPVLTPRYYKREWCREETLKFLKLAEEQGFEPLVFPVLFLPDHFPDSACEVRAALRPFQYKDFIPWRHGGPTERSRLENAYAEDIARRLHERLHRSPAAASSVKVVKSSPSKLDAPIVATETSAEGRTREAAPPPPTYPTLVVDPMPRRGDHTSIQAAIDAAEPGSRILIRPGTYREALRLSKPLELIGDGDRDRIVVTTAEGDALICDAPMARVIGLTLRREPGDEDYALWITSGSVEVEDCVITSHSLASASIQGSEAAPTLRRCRLTDSPFVGLAVSEGARPTLEDCEFIGNTNGSTVRDEETRATFRRCLARDNKNFGFVFAYNTTSLVDDCEAIGNKLGGVVITEGAAPRLHASRFRSNPGHGVYINKAGRGRLEGCVVGENGNAGIEVRDNGLPEVRGCTITGNKWEAVRIIDGGGVFEGNDLRGNERGAWLVTKGAEENLTRSDNRE
ncbi:MAG: right-handed parallel beta-helix repeat-containing protein [Hyphomicrobiales bacterium]|nr:right-handed parallel beta-helix repeat-containing protein [Hyphomicrobiales bacterium]